MKISKKDALIWFEFFSQLPEDEEVMIKQQEIIYATFAQIEAAIDHRNDMLMSEIKGLKTLENRTYFVEEMKVNSPKDVAHVSSEPVWVQLGKPINVTLSVSSVIIMEN